MALAQLHPTQFAVGYGAVEIKRQQWRDPGIAERKRLMQRRRVPVMIGRDDIFYIVDRHHWLLALADDGVERAGIVVMDDLQQLDAASFWPQRETRAHCHIIDAQGVRRSAIELPIAITYWKITPSAASPKRSAGRSNLHRSQRHSTHLHGHAICATSGNRRDRASPRGF